ncbi:MAG: peptidyl-prolyl cis-trans isomerase C [Candidatus Tokpelaia sp. JSC085]|nr:MAG: peptidyl-prolyl cis-trans isomerase C [Candidatus Tokpelaia sp. JSC085]
MSMSKNYRKALIASLFFFGSGLTVIAQTPEKPHGETSQRLIDPFQVMAIINGESLTAGQLDDWSKIIHPEQDATVEQKRLQTLRLLINLRAFTDAALSEKLDETQEFEKRMELMRESTLQQLYIDRKIMTPVADTELKARYEKEMINRPKELEIRARHILLKTEKEANALIQQLTSGDDFEKLAREKSTDGSASLGGDLGYFTKGQMIKSFEDVAFSLKIGEYSTAPVETPFGWHIIKVEDMRQKEPPTFNEAKSYIQNLILRQRYNDLQKNVLAKIKVSYPDDAIAKAMEQDLSGEEEIEEINELEEE